MAGCSRLSAVRTPLAARSPADGSGSGGAFAKSDGTCHCPPRALRACGHRERAAAARPPAALPRAAKRGNGADARSCLPGRPTTSSLTQSVPRRWRQNDSMDPC
eukprot:180105-Chlamydomonas_euryale.AAC.4